MTVRSETDAGDRTDLVAVLLPRSAAAEAIRRVWNEGRAVLPVDPAAPEGEVDRLLDRLRPTHVWADGAIEPRDGGAPAAPGAAAVVATSGTTGEPKGVELTFAGLEASARAVTGALGAGEGDGWLCCLPVHHVAGLAIVARSWVTGAPLVVHDRFDVDAVGASGDGRMVSLVPTMLGRLLDAGVPVERFARVLLGGGPVPAELRRRAEGAGTQLTTTYGMTETWGGVVHDGHVLDGAELRCSPGGELLVRGPMVTPGYRLDPELTAASFHKGWLRTGDAGVVDGDGAVRVTDRIKDLIVSGGVNVSPTEVEAVLAEHPAIADVCVTGATDPEWGERVVAWVVPAGGSAMPSVDDLRAFARDRLSAPKLPRQVVGVESVPRTAGGKPRRGDLPPAPPDGTRG